MSTGTITTQEVKDALSAAGFPPASTNQPGYRVSGSVGPAYDHLWVFADPLHDRVSDTAAKMEGHYRDSLIDMGFGAECEPDGRGGVLVYPKGVVAVTTPDRTAEVMQSIRIHHESASHALSVGDVEHWCLKALVDVDAPRIIAALDEVLKLADGARPTLSFPPADCTNVCNDGPCNCSGEFRPGGWELDPEAIREVISRALSRSSEPADDCDTGPAYY